MKRRIEGGEKPKRRKREWDPPKPEIVALGLRAWLRRAGAGAAFVTGGCSRLSA